MLSKDRCINWYTQRLDLSLGNNQYIWFMMLEAETECIIASYPVSWLYIPGDDELYPRNA